MRSPLRHHFVVESDGHEGVATRKRKTELRRHHSDNRVRLAVKFEGLPDRVCRAAKLPLPQSVTEDDHVIGTLAVLLRYELAPEGVRWEAGKYPRCSAHPTQA